MPTTIPPQKDAAILQVAGLWAIEMAKYERSPIDGRTLVNDDILMRNMWKYYDLLLKEFSQSP